MSRGLARFLKYSSIGVSTFAFDLALLYLLVDVFGVPHVPAAAGAFLVAVSINYALSRRYVFAGTLTGVGEGYAKFLSIAGAGLLFVTVGMYFLVDVVGVSYLIARIAVAIMTGFWNYLMNLYVNFKVAGQHDHS